jgi:hypothetical protein
MTAARHVVASSPHTMEGIPMKRWLIFALASAGATAAPIDMALFESTDHDRNGYVDIVEVAASIELQGRFNDIDTDRDGRISAAEMQAWIERPDKGHAFSTAAPVDVHEQWRAAQERQRALESERVERILSGDEAQPVVPAEARAQ